MLGKKKTSVRGYETEAGKAVAPYVANRSVGSAKGADAGVGQGRNPEAARHLNQIGDEQNPAGPEVPDVNLAWRQRSVSRLLRRFLNSSPTMQKTMAPGLATEINSMAAQGDGKEKNVLLKISKIVGKIPGRKGLAAYGDWEEVREEMVREYTRRGQPQEAQRIKEAPTSELYRLYTDPQMHAVIVETLLRLDEGDAADVRDALAKLDLSVVKRQSE